MATIYRKTGKGQNEIETRALKLAPRFRSLLILVDGRRSDTELLTLLPQTGDELLQALAQGGFIEAIGVTADDVRSQPSRPSVAPAASAVPAGFEQRRSQAVHALIDQVGPIAESLALKMERARTASELKPLIETAAQVLANTRGRAAAAEYSRRYGAE